jgi:hypothetical protein
MNVRKFRDDSNTLEPGEAHLAFCSGVPAAGKRFFDREPT